VTFDELYRVFGEPLINAVKEESDGHAQVDTGQPQKVTSGQSGHTHIDHLDKMDTPLGKVDMAVLLENERLKAEKAGIENLVQELRDQLERERDRLDTTEQKNRQLETQYRALLEDKRHYEDQGKRITELQEQQETLTKELTESKQKKSWFQKWFST
jgi:predicted RNase H-like nuclease (RuvC/YqgF family)